MSDSIIFPEDENSARYMPQIWGWVSSNGRFFGEDEKLARWDGATHIHCECGEVIKKQSALCKTCAEKRQDEIYNKKAKKLWDGESPMVLFNTDLYFCSSEDVLEYCEELDININELKLMLCEPIIASPINPEDYYYDVLSDDGDIPDELQEIFDELNEKLNEKNIILSWVQSNYAVILS